MSSVNIIFSMLSRDFHDLVVNSIFKEIEIGNSLAITEKYSGNIGCFDSTFEMGDCFRAYYYKYREYVECPPIDDILINIMHPYDMEVLKMMDRHQGWKWNYEKRMQVYYEYIRFWDYILERYRVNMAVFLNIPHEAFDYVIYCLCKIRGIHTVTFFTPPIFYNRSIVSNDFREENVLFQEFIKEYYKSDVVFGKEVTEKYESLALFSSEVKGKKKEKWWKGSAKKDIIKYMSVMDVRNYIEIDKKENILRRIVERYRHVAGILARVYYLRNSIQSIILDKKYRRVSGGIVPNEKYILFMLHYQPEATSAPWGGGIYSNQIIPIRILAKSLPEGVLLYVKEHPIQSHIGRDPLIYSYLSKINNVRLISKEIDSNLLINHAIAVASLTGTIIIESVTKGIPAIAFGNSLYNCLEGVYNVRTYDECKEAIKQICDSEIVIDDSKVKKFFQAIHDYSYPINIGYFEYDDNENAKEMSIILKKIIRSMLS